ncbi:WD40/YVTN/BNR-like repeat-containing protein, partial [Flavobacterium sp.]|uniref:WD40/YVTN/BNR-like repeat-containing protein n=1 Tax=Flavobacterium sp. TaxID=239 RepID=UPI003752B337
MKTKIYLLLFFLFILNSFSQETKMNIKDFVNFSDLPAKTNDTPSWANQFYTNPEQINVKKLKTDINNWVIAEKREKKDNVKKENRSEQENELKENISENPIVRFAINFVKKVPSNWINDAGFIVMPTTNAFFKEADDQEKNRTSNYNKNNNKNVSANNWSQIGSKEITENGKQIVSSTNIYFISVAPSSTNIRLASGETGLLYKTTDGGANWSTISENTGPSAFHPTDVNKIILGSNPFRLSSDGGATWTVKPVTAECNEILWSNNGTTILAATNQGVFVSSDGGINFSIKQTGSFMDVEFKPGSSTIAYAINNAGVFYKSTDAGLTWVVKPTNYNSNNNKNGFLIAVSDANPELVCIASLTGTTFDVGNAVEIIKSTNSGENFALLSNSSIGYSQGFYDFVFGISPTDVNTYFFGICSFYKSTNGGLTFNAIGGYNPPFGTHPDMQDMVLFGNTVVLSTDGGVSESTDSFTSLDNWKSTCKGLVGLDYWGFDLGFNTDQMGGGKYHNGNNMFNPEWNNGKALHLGGGEEANGKTIFSRPNSMFFSGVGKNFKQIDITYNPNFTVTFPFTLENNLYLYGTRNSDTTSNTIDSNIVYSGTGNSIMISYDNGATGQVLKNFGSPVWDIKTTRKDSKVIYVMTETTGLWKTIDGGINWTSCNITLNNVDLIPEGLKCLIDVSQTNTNEIWLIHKNYFSDAKVFKSTDGGQVWTDLLTPTINNIEPRQILHQYGSDGGVYFMGRIGSDAKCYYRDNTMTDWVEYSANLMTKTLNGNVFLKATYFKEKLRVAGSLGVQEISFYKKSNPVAQPTTNIKDVCVNQEIKFSDYSILDYAGATWEW